MKSNFNVDADIRAHRTTQATVKVLQPDGAPLAHQEVKITQTNHQFLFGAGFFDLPLANGELSGERKALSENFFEKQARLCNFATLPFYWGRFEHQKGRPETARTKKAAQFCIDHNMVLKGHPLCWHTVTADWLLSMSNPEILKAQIARIHREVSAFRGLIDMWDVINEVVIMPIFDKYDNGITRICKELGRINTVRTMFEATRESNPGATLLINDFDMSPAYDILIEGCLEAGIKIDVIGVQSHMHQGYWGVEKTLSVLEQFSRFNLPIHFTETSLVSGELMPAEIVDLNDFKVDKWPSTPEGEARQAEETITHYKTLMANPLVECITWWGLIDGGWLKAPSGLIRIDGSTKPAYDELLKLVKGEWWLAPSRFTTDERGYVTFTGFLGAYELEFAGKQQVFNLNQKGETSVEIHL